MGCIIGSPDSSRKYDFPLYCGIIGSYSIAPNEFPIYCGRNRFIPHAPHLLLIAFIIIICPMLCLGIRSSLYCVVICVFITCPSLMLIIVIVIVLILIILFFNICCCIVIIIGISNSIITVNIGIDIT